jgi:hypothetical protein
MKPDAGKETRLCLNITPPFYVRIFKNIYVSSIHFPVGSQLEHRAHFGVSVITHTIRHTVRLLWTSD